MDEKWQELYNGLLQDLWSLTRTGGTDRGPGQTPMGDSSDQGMFIAHERAKMDRFHLTHAAFIAYINSGEASNDPQYFLRRSFDPAPSTYVRPFDRDPEYGTAGDWILTLLTGNDMYEHFLQGCEGSGRI
jgi:hypothetical protein